MVKREHDQNWQALFPSAALLDQPIAHAFYRPAASVVKRAVTESLAIEIRQIVRIVKRMEIANIHGSIMNPRTNDTK